MRKVLFSLLLATVSAAPALAAPKDGDDRSRVVEDRHTARQEAAPQRQQSQSGERPQGVQGGGRPDFQFARPQVAPPVDARPENHQNFDRQRWIRPQGTIQPEDRHFEDRNPDQRQWGHPAPNVQQAPSGFSGQPAGDSVTNWRSHEREATRQQRTEDSPRDQINQDRFERNQDRGYVRRIPPAYARPDRPAPIPETASNYDWRRSPQWHTDWRNDRRYDWHHYRDRHRSIFRIGFYYDPFGWGYQRYNVGWRLWPAYYGEDYWLQDPYMYDLPYAPWPYKWVRYYNDALLVNVFTGQVVDTIYDFFW